MKPFDVAELLGISDMPTHLKKIEAGLAKATATDNPSLQQPILRLVSAGSKRLRSVLVIATADSQNKPIDDTIISGCVAIELVHIGSLVHDDIIDNADTRWGIPTVNNREGANQAILVGDFLFAQAGVVAASINAAAAGLISSTIATLVDGESREVADEFNMERTLESMYAAIHGKTAALVSAACQMGGICAGSGKKELDAYARYGEAFGTAFQLIDDILDFLSSEELMGKPVGNDVKEGVYTLPLLISLQGQNADDVRRILKQNDINHSELSEYIKESGGFSATINETKKYNHDAVDALKYIHGSSALARLPDEYMTWAMSNLVQNPVT